MSSHSLTDLLTLVENLRSPEGGCPWDRKQTHDSLTPFLIEEAYEVLEAIAKKDISNLKEELGDVLFQVVLHSQLAEEVNDFSFEDVVSALVEKMLRRHPHVFPDGSLASFGEASVIDAVEVANQWQQIKNKEKEQSKEGLLDSVSNSLPPFLQAVKLQKKAATVGFDWTDFMPVFSKIREELTELEAAINEKDQSHIQEELGDLFFALANLARHLNIDPDLAIMGTNQKFRRRFSRIESLLKDKNKKLQDCDLEELDQYWDRAKSEGL